LNREERKKFNEKLRALCGLCGKPFYSKIKDSTSIKGTVKI
jgi:hypothetical protein